MERSFKIRRDYWCSGIKLFDKGSMTFHSGVTALVGCNGAGKSTVLSCIAENLAKDGTEFVRFDNLSEGGSRARERAGYEGNMDFLMTSLVSSEGENICMNVRYIVQNIALGMKKCQKEEKKEFWILLDAIDSGMSIDNVVELKRLFGEILDESKERGIETFIIAAANEYELVRGSDPFDVMRCRYIEIPSYDEYFRFIMKTADKKEKRYKEEK